MTLSDSVAWVFNVRGSDIPHTPVALAFAIVPVSGKPELFLAADKLAPAVRAQLEAFAKVSDPSALDARLKVLRSTGKRVRLDPNTAGYWFARALGGTKRIARGPDPSLSLKAIKNLKYRYSSVAVSVVGEVAWASFDYRLDGVTKGKPLAIAGKGTLVLRKTGDAWRIVHSNTSGRPAA